MNQTTRNTIPLLAAAMLLRAASASAGGVQVGSITGSPGSTVSIPVTLSGEVAELIAGTQNDILFDPTLVSVPSVAENGNKPDCIVNAAINKKIDGSQTFGFGFLKGSVACDPLTETCDAVRAIVLSTDNVDAIPAGSTLFNCKFKIADSTTSGQQIPLSVENAIGSDPTGQRLATFTAQGGTITVGLGVSCLGDCNGADGVSIGELQIGLNIFFGAQAVSTCAPFDPNSTGGVGIGQLQIALNNFFGGCS